jgi:hypothetical protein
MVNGDEKTIKSEPVEKPKEGEELTETDPLPADTDEAVVPAEQDSAVAPPPTTDENSLASLMPPESGVPVEEAAAALHATEDSAEAAMQGLGDVNPLGDTMEEQLVNAMEMDTTAAAAKSMTTEAFMSGGAPVEPAVSYSAELSNSEVESGAYDRSNEAKGQPMTEEDLLTGPAHNLDDSQYKSDMVDPNLDDIFK